MSAWRRIAITKLPKYKTLIAKSESVGMLWVDLWLIFLDAHKDPIDLNTIQAVYEFASWTCSNTNDDIATSTCCHFYEHLPLEMSVRKLLSKFMTKKDIDGFREIFKYHLSPEEHQNFMHEFGNSRTY